MSRESFQQQLLEALYSNREVNIYDFGFDDIGLSSDEFKQSRQWAHQLVKDKLAIYTDEEKTSLCISNYGRYWMLQGGYMVFLREGTGFKSREEKQQKMELLDDRLRLTHYRLLGFWIALVISLIGLASLGINIFLLMRK